VPRSCEDGAVETARVLRRRYDCLRAIVTEPREKRALVEATETPRSTLDDIVRELESAGLVTYDDGVWRPTTSGRVAAEVHADCGTYRLPRRSSTRSRTTRRSTASFWRV